MPKTHTRFICQSCGFDSPKWLGKCPDCGEWASLVEEFVEKSKVKSGKRTDIPSPTPISSINTTEAKRFKTNISEFDRVLGGGVVAGSLVLIGGDPGIGKSTLLLQAAETLSGQDSSVLYISGEESVDQIKLRANRLGVSSDNLLLANATDISIVDEYISTNKPSYLIIDSIQTMHDSDLSSAPGTVSQVRSCTASLMETAKKSNIPVFIVGHVTKEGTLAGPRVLEHMVDTVLYFEGDKHMSYRILRAVKNRFGSTDEIGIFEMREEGLISVENPSEVLLAERPGQTPGSVVTATIEGSRPLLVEIQALVSQTYFPAPRRMCTGVDYNKTIMIMAVLEKRAGFSLGNKDVYVNVAGGVKIVEPASDLAVALSIASSTLDTNISYDLIALGEIGLAGEVRAISQIEKRINEAKRLGFTTAIVPAGSIKNNTKTNGMKIKAVNSLNEAIDYAFNTNNRKTGV
ncbi:MAG: DNA repair protein RadA [Armatimonadota bacterium]